MLFNDGGKLYSYQTPQILVQVCQVRRTCVLNFSSSQFFKLKTFTQKVCRSKVFTISEFQQFYFKLGSWQREPIVTKCC